MGSNTGRILKTVDQLVGLRDTHYDYESTLGTQVLKLDTYLCVVYT